MKFVCASCGEEHDTSQVGFGAVAPAQWQAVDTQNAPGCTLGEEDCLITAPDGEVSLYLRAVLELPLQGAAEVFTFGVWVSLAEETMREIYASWDDPERSSRGPYFGWLCTALPEYPDTLLLKTMVHMRGPGQRPWVELEPTDHPLAREQREGLEPERAAWLISRLLHAD